MNVSKTEKYFIYMSMSMFTVGVALGIYLVYFWSV